MVWDLPEPVAPAKRRTDVEWHAAGPPAASTAPTSDDEGAPPTHREELLRRWYGWQILLSDGAAIASFVAASNGPGWAYVGLSLYAGGGPIIHAAHGSGEKAAGSLGVVLTGPHLVERFCAHATIGRGLALRRAIHRGMFPWLIGAAFSTSKRPR